MTAFDIRRRLDLALSAFVGPRTPSAIPSRWHINLPNPISLNLAWHRPKPEASSPSTCVAKFG